jgi:hypothetical protein
MIFIVLKKRDHLCLHQIFTPIVLQIAIVTKYSWKQIFPKKYEKRKWG